METKTLTKAEHIRQLLQEGKTRSEVAKATGAHYSQVHGIAKSLGVDDAGTKREKTKVSDEKKEELSDAEGLLEIVICFIRSRAGLDGTTNVTVVDIAKEYGLAINRIQATLNLLKEKGRITTDALDRILFQF